MSCRALQLLLPVFLLAFLAVAGPAQASEQYFIKIAGIPGDSTYQNHENEIVVDSFSWNVTAPATRNGGGKGAGKPTFSDFTFAHRVDSASPLLFRAVTRGDRIRSARFSVKTISEQPTDVLQYCLEDVMVTGVNASGKTSDDTPNETVTLNPLRFAERVIPLDSSGQPLPPVFWSWDIGANRSVIGFNDSCGT